MIDPTFFKDKKVAFHTLGCKLNFVETSYIGKLLLDNGFKKAKSNEVADVCVVNTCSVTEVADRKGRQAIKQMINKNPGAFVIVTGCYAQLKPEEISQIEGVDLILGSQQKFDIISHLAGLEKRKKALVLSSNRSEIKMFFPTCTRGDRTRYFLKVQDGCDYFCSYCTIPIARGRSRNATVDDTVRQAKMAAINGAKEIVITGVNIGDFGKTTGETFLDLIKALDMVDGIQRYRISSLEPDLLTDEIIAYTTNSTKFVPHFHIPLQSGNDEILSLMKRRYNRALFADKVCQIKSLMPNAFIGVDVIVGMNGETLDRFEDSVCFLDSLDISQLHVFSYSERPNTQALQIGMEVSPVEKKRRSEVLHLLSEQKRLKFYGEQQGATMDVLWEEKKSGDYMHGFTANYVRVQRPYSKMLVNQITPVKLGDYNNDKSALMAVVGQ